MDPRFIRENQDFHGQKFISLSNYPTSLESDFYSNPPGRYGFLSMKILIFPHNPRVYIAGASGDRETIPSVFSLGVHRLFG